MSTIRNSAKQIAASILGEHWMQVVCIDQRTISDKVPFGLEKSANNKEISSNLTSVRKEKSVKQNTIKIVKFFSCVRNEYHCSSQLTSKSHMWYVRIIRSSCTFSLYRFLYVSSAHSIGLTTSKLCLSEISPKSNLIPLHEKLSSAECYTPSTANIDAKTKGLVIASLPFACFYDEKLLHSIHKCARIYGTVLDVEQVKRKRL